VTCTVQDADQRSASCSFNVTVTAPPVLQRTRFVAFGDSMTEGSLSLCFVQSPRLRTLSFREDAALIRSAVNVPFSYPSQLQALLAQRYTAQKPTVINEGFGGETVVETMFTGEGLTGLDRFPGVLSAHQPEVLLLMHGINDIHQGIRPVELVAGLRQLVQQARSRGIVVYLGTLLPQRLGACRNYALASDIHEANDRIKAMGIVEGARLVDLHAAFAGNEDSLLGPDGLHPNEAGYKAMADTFFAAIRSNLEASSVMAPPGLAVRSGGR
jgi:lysophospholipase L1-like esterase